MAPSSRSPQRLQQIISSTSLLNQLTKQFPIPPQRLKPRRPQRPQRLRLRGLEGLGALFCALWAVWVAATCIMVVEAAAGSAMQNSANTALHNGNVVQTHTHSHTHTHTHTRHHKIRDRTRERTGNPQVENITVEELRPCPNCVNGDRTSKHMEKSAPAHSTHSTHSTQSPPQHMSSDSIRLEVIKHQILSKLGLTAKPNVTTALPRDVVLKTLYRAEESRELEEDMTVADDSVSGESERPTSVRVPMQTNPPGEPDDYYGRTREIITFAEQGHILNGQKLLEFSLSRGAERSPGQKLSVKGATLWVRVDFRPNLSKKARRLISDRSLIIWVFRVNSFEKNATHLSCKEFDKQTEMSASLSVQMSDLGWQKIDMTPTIRNWYSEGDNADRLRLLVDCSGCSEFVIVHLFHKVSSSNYYDARPESNRNEEIDPNRPFLIVHTDPSVTKRVRRRALDCSGALKGQCCKQRFYVSFQALGWDDWIIAPTGYFANYCRGDCGSHRTPETFLSYYTHVIEEYRKMDKLSGMQPCCAPLKFSSMSLIYFGPDYNIIKRDLPKMVVDECGCP